MVGSSDLFLGNLGQLKPKIFHSGKLSGLVKKVMPELHA